MATIVVTGGSGFIGRQVVAALTAAGANLVAFGRGNPPPDLPERVHWRKVDLLTVEQEELLALFREAQAQLLVHLAWETRHGLFWTSNDNLAWLAASLDLTRAFIAEGGTRIVATGTCVEYNAPVQGPCSETSTPIAPKHLYGVTKNELRCALRGLQERGQISYAWARIFFPFGPYEKPGRLVPGVIDALLDGREAQCTEGSQVRDFMDVRDCGAAIAALAMSRVSGEVNIGSGQPLRLADLVLRIGELMGSPDLIRLGALPMRPEDPSNLWPDIGRLRDEVGFIPRYRLDDSIECAVAWRNAERRARSNEAPGAAEGDQKKRVSSSQ